MMGNDPANKLKWSILAHSAVHLAQNKNIHILQHKNIHLQNRHEMNFGK